MDSGHTYPGEASAHLGHLRRIKLDHLEVKAETIEQAKKKLFAEIPDGHFATNLGDFDPIESEERASADTVEQAFKEAKSGMVEDECIINETVLREPYTETVTVAAFSEQEAVQTALSTHEYTEGIVAKKATLQETGSSGFLGIGKKPNLYSVDLFYKALVSVHFATSAEAEAYLTDDKDIAEDTFVEAVIENEYDHVKHLLDRGIDIHKLDSNDATALMLSAFKGHNKISYLLLEKGIDVSRTDASGFNALILACECTDADLSLIKKLINAGIDVNATSKGGATALMTAAKLGHIDAVKLLISKGADINAKNFEHNITALIWAANEGHFHVAECLLENGADPTVVSTNGYTAASIAQENGYYSISDLITRA